MNTDDEIRKQLTAAQHAAAPVIDIHRKPNRHERRAQESKENRSLTLADAKLMIKRLTRIVSYCAAATEEGEIVIQLEHVNGPLPDVEFETTTDAIIIRCLP
jgi:hypothetical protein